ncbi:hypothetical protein ABZ891_36910 [Streptomyces sp. NPDC047023]|uniref:hypothetical protein n=1 Tax=Streptomyces sp. NPDC047023 TaxID=3155139 RepID=UPI0033CF903E
MTSDKPNPDLKNMSAAELRAYWDKELDGAEIYPDPNVESGSGGVGCAVDEHQNRYSYYQQTDSEKPEAT